MLSFEIPYETYFREKDLDQVENSHGALEYLVSDFERSFSRELDSLKDANNELVEIINNLLSENEQLREAANGYKLAYEDLANAHFQEAA